MSSLFDTLRTELSSKGYDARSREAREWFTDKVRELNGRINRKSLLNDDALRVRSQPIWGHMFMFVYDPKMKEELPYYDRFPLVLALQPAKDGFLGLNLHYLRPDYRAAFLDKLMDTLPGKGRNLDEKTKLRVRYSLLSGVRRFRMFAPCIKHYLSDHVKSRISQVYAPDWETAIFLPTEHFAKANKVKVWKDSQKIYQSR
jgi:hypothetical protein